MTAIPSTTSAIPTTTSASSPVTSRPRGATDVRARRHRRVGTIRLIGAAGATALAMVAAGCGSDTNTTTTPGAATTQPPVAAANAAYVPNIPDYEYADDIERDDITGKDKYIDIDQRNFIDHRR